MNFIYNVFQWIYYWLLSYFIVILPGLQDMPLFGRGQNEWYNTFDGFYYNTLGLRFDMISNTYIDLFSNQYWYDHNQQIYFNDQGMRFDNFGFRRSLDQRRAIDFYGNHYYYCPITNAYQYSGLWSSALVGHNLNQTTPKPLTGVSVATRVFLLKNSMQLDFLKTGFTGLMLSSFITVVPIWDLSMNIQNNPFKLEPTQVAAQFTFKNMENVLPNKSTETSSLTKPIPQKSSRLSASANLNTYGFKLNSLSNPNSLSFSKNPEKYDKIDLLYDIKKCFNVYTKTFKAQKQEQNVKLDPYLNSGIEKLYNQITIATKVAVEKQA